MDLALTLASSTNHHLFSSLDSQPQIGWLSIFRDTFLTGPSSASAAENVLDTPLTIFHTSNFKKSAEALKSMQTEQSVSNLGDPAP
jgi:hypothetical protein